MPKLLTPSHHSARSAQPLEGFSQIKHEVPMLSLDNVFTPEELMDFDRRMIERLGSDTPFRWYVNLN